MLSAACGRHCRLSNILNEEIMRIKTFRTVREKIARYSGKPGSQMKSDLKRSRYPPQLVTPQLQEEDRHEIRNVVGIHLTSSIISWAKLSLEGHVICWNIKNLEPDLQKMHPTRLLTLARGIKNDLPHSDVYVMEDMSKKSLSPQQASLLPLKLSEYELRAMLLTLLNESVNTENMQGNLNGKRIHRLYYLRAKTYARLFRALVASERISLEDIVLDIISSSKKTNNNLNFSPITLDNSLLEKYLHKNNINREYMGQSLLLTMAFIDLVVKKTEESLKYISLKR